MAHKISFNWEKKEKKKAAFTYPIHIWPKGCKNARDSTVNQNITFVYTCIVTKDLRKLWKKYRKQK